MTYHKPAKKEEILLGKSEEYHNTIPIVEDFEIFIKSISELSEYTEEELKRVGINFNYEKMTSELNSWRASLRKNGVLYQLSFYLGSNCFIEFNAIQYGETAETAKLRELTGGIISGQYRTMSFTSRTDKVTRKMYTKHFCFKGDETRDNSVEKYIDGIILHPDKKLVYSDEDMYYKDVYKENDERPGRTFDTTDIDNYPGYINSDKTPFTLDPPESMTTYSSFDSARSEMKFKLNEFRQAWENALQALKDKRDCK